MDLSVPDTVDNRYKGTRGNRYRCDSDRLRCRTPAWAARWLFKILRPEQARMRPSVPFPAGGGGRRVSGIILRLFAVNDTGSFDRSQSLRGG